MTRRETESLNRLSTRSSSNTSSDSDVSDEKLDNDSNRRSEKTEKISSSFSSDHDFVSQVIKVLDLDDDSTDSKLLGHELLINGRQALSKSENDISRGVYKAQMNKDGSELLNILKNYIEKQWESNTEEWLQIFLKEQKTESPDLYDQILTRTAEYGPKYLKDNSSLSLILQFLFEFNDQALQNGQLFDNVWNTLTTYGRQSLAQYSEHLARIVLTEQLENDKSPLSLALKGYFLRPLLDLLNKINKSNMLEVSLNFVMKYGWREGLNQSEVQDRLAPNKSEALMKELEEYLATLIPTIASIIIDDHQQPIEQDEYLGRNHEMTVVTMCTDEYDKWQLAELVEAGELMYIDKKFDDVIDIMIRDYCTQQNFTEFIKKCLQSIMYLLKRHQSLEDFTGNLFFKYSQAQLPSTAPELNMRMIVHILLLKSDFSLSRMIMSLLSKRNSVPFLQPSVRNTEHHQFVADIIHVWDYKTPTILSFGIGKCEGKSTLLNTIFMSSFEISRSNIYFQETIDIDFGYSFIPRRLTNIADSHGSMRKELFIKIHDLFDGFIIHIEYSYLKQNIQILKSYLDIALQRSKYCLILIRDVPLNLREECSNLIASKLSLSIQTVVLPNISDPNKTENKHNILKLHDTIFQTIPTQCLYEIKYIQTQLRNLFNEKYKEQLHEIYATIMPLKHRLIDVIQNEEKVSIYFPQYMTYAELCRLKLQLASYNFYGNENDKIVFEVRRQIYELESLLTAEGQKCGIIFDLFIQILKSSNMLMCLDLLSTDLKAERLQLIPISEMSKELPIHKNLSLEVLWRNTIICECQQSEQMKTFLYQKYYEYIRSGYPFEIIDGDNFYFHQKFLIEALTLFRDKKTLVISIIGPQNSGKSTLLNYMFGTLFDVRDGRCTRGIYGSFVKSNRSDFDYIMLIDTEGLLGVERKDPEYDRRIILFCLAVSHLVIVNMVGEVNSALQTMMNLCTDSLKQMGVTRIPQPTVHFILNQKADLNNENNRAAIDRIVSDLRQIGPAIDIRNESFHTLPSAFKKGSNLTSNAKLPSVIKTEPDFLEHVQILCGELIKSAETVYSRSTEFSDPLQWIKSSFIIFETLQKFSDLTFYHDISERQQDNEVREHIRQKLTEVFSSAYRNELIEGSINKTENEIIQMFNTEQSQIQKLVNQDLENVLKLLKASSTIRKRSKQFLDAQITAAFNALRTTSIVANEREKVKLLVRDGEGDLRQLIDDTIKSGIVMSPNIASDKFEIMFNNSVEHIQCKFIPHELVQNALKYIFTNYNIYETEDLPKYQYLLNYLSILIDFNDTQLSINDLQDEFILAFTKLGYEHQESVEVHSFTNDDVNLYSFEEIESLIYLNKEAIEEDFIKYLQRNNAQLIQQNFKSTQSKKNLHQFFKSMISRFRDKKPQASSQPVISTANFLRDVRSAIRDQKPKISQAAIVENHMYVRISVFIRDIIQKIFKEMKSPQLNQTRQIQTELIQTIVGLVNTLIIHIDNELRPFCLSLSLQLKSVFHVCAIVLLTTFYFNEQKNHFQQTLFELNEKKNDLKTYFVQMVVPNAATDTNSAISFTKQFQEYIIKSFKSTGQRLINIELQQYDYLNRKSIQDLCDGQLLMNTNMKWLMNYIEHPTDIIEEEFKNLWEKILKAINQTLIESKTNYYSVLSEFFFCLQGIMDSIKTFRCSSATFIQDIFQSNDNNSLNINENLTHKKRCMAILLFYYMSGQQTPQTIIVKATTCHPTTENIETKTYKLKRDVFDLFQLLSVQRPPSDTLKKITKEMSTTYDRISIDNLVAFLQHALNEKNKFLKEFNELKSDFNTIDKQDTYSRLLQKVKGCSDLCPCCKRPCDVDHTQIKSSPGSQYNEHRCITGHALRAMNGYKFEVTGEASLLMCEHIKDNQTIIDGIQRIKWSQFKLNHSDWDFVSTMNDDQLTKLHGKFLGVWMKIGPELCRKYNMKYVVSNTVKQDVDTYESFHWILLLDKSGSMAGKRWKDLLQAVQGFLTYRRALNTNDRITIITFSDTADYVCYDEQIQNANLENIPDPNGQTSFSKAFARVNESIKRTNTNNATRVTTVLNYAIIFMTDGEDEYPEKELNQLVNEHGTNIRFWTLVLGDDLEPEAKIVLEQINGQMNGRYYSLEASSALSQTFAEIANNTNSTNY